ncbi:MAG: hypothetical protein QM627_09010 [Luteolibacter sp.]
MAHSDAGMFCCLKCCEEKELFGSGGCGGIAWEVDRSAPLHHGAIMRLTINLDDDLYAMARSHAIATKTSISKAVNDLFRRRVVSEVARGEDDPSTKYFDPVLGIQVSRSEKPITEEDIQRALDDEDLRHLEAMGLTWEDLKR